MPGVIEITVNATGVSSDPQVAKGGAQPIRWVCGTGIASFAISGLSSPPFSQSGTNGQVTTFNSTDTNNNNTGSSIDYNYTVTPTASSSGGEAAPSIPLAPFDPYIRNLS